MNVKHLVLRTVHGGWYAYYHPPLLCHPPPYYEHHSEGGGTCLRHRNRAPHKSLGTSQAMLYLWNTGMEVGAGGDRPGLAELESLPKTLELYPPPKQRRS